MRKGYLTTVQANLKAARLPAYRLSKVLQIPRQTVYHFLAGRYSKAGKQNCRLIRAWLRKNNCAPIRKPTFCRDCRAPYPTRKVEKVPPELLKKPPIEGHVS